MDSGDVEGPPRLMNSSLKTDYSGMAQEDALGEIDYDKVAFEKIFETAGGDDANIGSSSGEINSSSMFIRSGENGPEKNL